MLNIKPSDVEAIQATYEEPTDRLLHIIITFLSQTEITPTWSVIVKALKSKIVNLHYLARKVEAAHATQIHETPAITAPGEIIYTTPFENRR